MNKALIRQLNKLNRQFYQQVATSFSDSRNYYWQGWNKLVPYFQELAANNQNKITVLDIGCGNGRFGSFLVEQLPEVKINYLGIDNSKELLKIAQSLAKNTHSKFIKLDIVDSILSKTFAEKLQSLSPNFIAALGVIHHIPGLEVRQQFISQLAQILSRPGYLTFTTWNFLDTKRFQKKIIDPNQVKINLNKLEKHDIILDWKRNKEAWRYCHYTDQEELKSLLKSSGLEKISQFKADGKSNQLNTYTILKK